MSVKSKRKKPNKNQQQKIRPKSQKGSLGSECMGLEIKISCHLHLNKPMNMVFWSCRSCKRMNFGYFRKKNINTQIPVTALCEMCHSQSESLTANPSATPAIRCTPTIFCLWAELHSLHRGSGQVEQGREGSVAAWAPCWVGDPFCPAQPAWRGSRSHCPVPRQGSEEGWCLRGSASKCLTQCHALVLSLWVLTGCTSESRSWPSLLLPVHEQLGTTSHHAGPGRGYGIRQDHIPLPYCCWAQALPSFLTIWQLNLKSWLDCKPMARFPLDTKWICCHYWLQNH